MYDLYDFGVNLRETVKTLFFFYTVLPLNVSHLNVTALFVRGCTSSGVYVPCIYTHARWELLQATHVFIVVFVSSAN